MREAWELAVDPEWKDQVSLRAIRGGVLDVAVRSASLRNELTHFHTERVLSVMRTALPDYPIVAVRFFADGAA